MSASRAGGAPVPAGLAPASIPDGGPADRGGPNGRRGPADRGPADRGPADRGPADRGTFCLVLHTHLPWLAHAGSWPVGEEWLYQAWAGSYLCLATLLARLAAEGRRHLLTLGVTPVLAAQLDDPYCLREFHGWLGGWLHRAEGAAAAGLGVAAHEAGAAREALTAFESAWVAGGSPVFRDLALAGAVELVGGAATHAFLPLLDTRLAAWQLETGLADAALRTGARPRGIWTPECAYRPGLEQLYTRAGVTHLVLDGPAVATRRLADLAGAHPTGATWRLADSDVAVLARDLPVTYRVWSPRAGYPGRPFYRDFHTLDDPSGLHPARVTHRRLPPERKQPYDPVAAAAAVRADAADFVRTVAARLDAVRAARGAPGLVVAAYDTELFGHWWHEGPAFLEAVLRTLPEAGVSVQTLSGALARHPPTAALPIGETSWGSGKDWRSWVSPLTAELQADSRTLGDAVLTAVDAQLPRGCDRSAVHDQLVRELMLAQASDWAFAVSKDSAADYARGRAAAHADRARALLAVVHAGELAEARQLAGTFRRLDSPFGHLDARLLASPPDRPSAERPERSGRAGTALAHAAAAWDDERR